MKNYETYIQCDSLFFLIHQTYTFFMLSNFAMMMGRDQAALMIGICARASELSNDNL